MKKSKECLGVFLLVGFFVLGGGTVPLQAQSSDYLYFVEVNSGIGRINLNGTEVEPDFITVPGGNGRVAGIAVNDKYIYWTNPNGNTGTTIGRADLDGQNKNMDFITGCSIPFGVAIDDNYIYWTNVNNATIGRATLDGKEVNQNFISGVPFYPVAIAVDGNFIYWTDMFHGSIGRAKLDGTLPNCSWITNCTSWPGAVTVTGTHIYWANSTDSIGRANLDGTNPEVWITGQPGDLTLPDGIGTKGEFIYWSNQYNGQIGRQNLNGSDYTPFWRQTGYNLGHIAFTLERYTFEGFFSPVDNIPTVNKANAGQAIPVKWRLTDKNCLPVSDPASFISIDSYVVNCATFEGDPTNTVYEPAAGSSGLQYLGDGRWQFNWKTSKSYSQQCRTMKLTLNDHKEYTASFSFK